MSEGKRLVSGPGLLGWARSERCYRSEWWLTRAIAPEPTFVLMRGVNRKQEPDADSFLVPRMAQACASAALYSRKRCIEVTETVVIASARSYDSTVDQFGAETITGVTSRRVDRSRLGRCTGRRPPRQRCGREDEGLGSTRLDEWHSRSSHAQAGGGAC